MRQFERRVNQRALIPHTPCAYIAAGSAAMCVSGALVELTQLTLPLRPDVASHRAHGHAFSRPLVPCAALEAVGWLALCDAWLKSLSAQRIARRRAIPYPDLYAVNT
jgi:hypothetical protein